MPSQNGMPFPSKLNLNPIPMVARDVVHGEKQNGSSSNGPDKQWEHHYHLPWAMYIVAMMLCGPQWQASLSMFGAIIRQQYKQFW